MKSPYIPALAVATAMLAFAVVPGLPYGYFQFLRWVACAAFCIAAIASYQRNVAIFIWIFAIMAILFNPIRTIHFDREIWSVIDILAGIVALTGMVILIVKDRNQAKSKKTEAAEPTNEEKSNGA
jgi:hypothetical protein